MLKKIILTTTTLTLLTTLSGCSFIPPKELTIDDNAQCDAFYLKKGQEFILRLPSSNGSSYHWEIENDASDILKVVKTKIRKADDDSDELRENESSWRFKAINTGQETLSLIYRLEWDTEVADQQRFQCNIIVNNQKI